MDRPSMLDVATQVSPISFPLAGRRAGEITLAMLRPIRCRLPQWEVIFPAPLGTLTSTALPSADIFNQMSLAQVSVAFNLTYTP